MSSHGSLRLCSFSFNPFPLVIHTGFCCSVAMSSTLWPHGQQCPSFAGCVILLAAPWLQHNGGCGQHVNGWANCDPTELHLQNKQQDRFSAQAMIRPPLFLRVCSKSCPLNHWYYLTTLSSVVPFSFLSSVFPSTRVFSNELALRIRWPKYWSFSLGINPSNEYSGLIFFRVVWFDLFTVQGTLNSLLLHHNLKASIPCTQPSLWSNSHICKWLLEKP